MSAFIVVELTVKDKEAKDRYSSAAAPILKEYGGEFVASGKPTMLFGETDFASSAIIKFEDRDAALTFYNSPSYQALLVDRAAGLDTRFMLVG